MLEVTTLSSPGEVSLFSLFLQAHIVVKLVVLGLQLPKRRRQLLDHLVELGHLLLRIGPRHRGLPCSDVAGLCQAL